MNAARAIARAAAALAAVLALAPAVAGSAESGALLDAPRAGPCVRDPALMRRIHPDLLRHERNDTVRLGIRDRKTDLQSCVNCHANAKDGSVLGSNTHFCQGCHAYAAVKLTCFECHSSRAQGAVEATASAGGKGGS